MKRARDYAEEPSKWVGRIKPSNGPTSQVGGDPTDSAEEASPGLRFALGKGKNALDAGLRAILER